MKVSNRALALVAVAGLSLGLAACGPDKLAQSSDSYGSSLDLADVQESLDKEIERRDALEAEREAAKAEQLRSQMSRANDNQYDADASPAPTPKHIAELESEVMQAQTKDTTMAAPELKTTAFSGGSDAATSSPTN